MQNNYDNRRADAEVIYAGFWVRLAAYLIDSVIVFFMLLVVRLILSGTLSVLSGTVLGGNILFGYTLKDIVLYLGQVLYFILCTRYTGTTPGKRAMNLRVVSVDESGELDLLNVVYRETVGRFLSGIFVCIGYLLIGVDREKRGFHDMLCDTRVVYGKRVKVYPAYPYPPVQPVGVPPVGTVPGSSGNGAGMPPMSGTADYSGSGAGMSTMEGTADHPGNGADMARMWGTADHSGSGAGMAAMGIERPGRINDSGTMPPPPMDRSGPYRMVHPNEQNVYPAEAVPPVPPVLTEDKQTDVYGSGESGMHTGIYSTGRSDMHTGAYGARESGMHMGISDTGGLDVQAGAYGAMETDAQMVEKGDSDNL